MKKLLLLLLLLGHSLTAWADVPLTSSYFPDRTFREYISANFDTDSDGTLTDAEISAVTSIDVSSKGISRLN